MFDIKTFPGIGIKENKINDTEIWFDPVFESWILGDKEERWMGINTFNAFQLKHFYSQYDLGYGNILCTGLGFGILPTWLASKPGVDKITVVEKSPEVINMFIQANPYNPKINIICQDANDYSSEEHFDCIFLDHYETQPWEKTVNEAAEISKRVPNHDLIWLWALEARYIEDYYPTNKISSRVWHDFSDKFNIYRKEALHGIKIPNLHPNKLNEYIYTFHNILQYGNITNYVNGQNFKDTWLLTPDKDNI